MHTRNLLIPILLTGAVCVLLFVLLRGGPTNTARQQEPVVQPPPTTAPVALNPQHIVPGKQVGPITLGMTQEAVKAALGSPDSTTNKIWSWNDPQMSVGFGPDSKAVVILAGGVGVSPNRVPFRSPDGIGIGSTPEQVIAAWGQPDTDRTEKAPLGVTRQVKYIGRGIELLFYDGELVWLSVRPAAAATTQSAS